MEAKITPNTARPTSRATKNTGPMRFWISCADGPSGFSVVSGLPSFRKASTISATKSTVTTTRVTICRTLTTTERRDIYSPWRAEPAPPIGEVCGFGRLTLTW